MNLIHQASANINPAVATSVHQDSEGKPTPSVTLPMVGALSATTVSLCIAAHAGWHRGGTLIEQVINMALGGVAVLYVHLVLARWNALRPFSRVVAFAFWCIGLIVVLYGQVAFFMVSQQHAGNDRAAASVNAMPPATAMPTGRTRTEIAREVAKLEADLARADARRCSGDCPTATVHKAILAARLAALKTEADEAKRREVEEDRLNEQADRNEALRATLRADPVASVVASWLHTTESRLELMLAVACAVVLEGAAIVGWLLVSLLIGRARGREMVVSSRGLTMRFFHAVAPPSRTETGDGQRDSREPGPPESAQDTTSTGNDADPVMSDDEQLLKQIQEAVRAGEADPTQESIRRLLRCGQPKAGRLNRLYQERYGCRGSRRADLQATQAETPDVAKI